MNGPSQGTMTIYSVESNKDDSRALYNPARGPEYLEPKSSIIG